MLKCLVIIRDEDKFYPAHLFAGLFEDNLWINAFKAVEMGYKPPPPNSFVIQSFLEKKIKIDYLSTNEKSISFYPYDFIIIGAKVLSFVYNYKEFLEKCLKYEKPLLFLNNDYNQDVKFF